VASPHVPVSVCPRAVCSVRYRGRCSSESFTALPLLSSLLMIVVVCTVAYEVLSMGRTALHGLLYFQLARLGTTDPVATSDPRPPSRSASLRDPLLPRTYTNSAELRKSPSLKPAESPQIFQVAERTGSLNASMSPAAVDGSGSHPPGMPRSLLAVEREASLCTSRQLWQDMTMSERLTVSWCVMKGDTHTHTHIHTHARVMLDVGRSRTPIPQSGHRVIDRFVGVGCAGVQHVVHPDDSGQPRADGVRLRRHSEVWRGVRAVAPEHRQDTAGNRVQLDVDVAGAGRCCRDAGGVRPRLQPATRRLSVLDVWQYVELLPGYYAMVLTVRTSMPRVAKVAFCVLSRAVRQSFCATPARRSGPSPTSVSSPYNALTACSLCVA
jgi:hypothetical protein